MACHHKASSPSSIVNAMGRLLNLSGQSLACVLKLRALKEAMLTVILRSSTPRPTSSLVQMEVEEVIAGGIMSYQKLS